MKVYRCDFESMGQICGRVFSHAQEFENHVKVDHDISLAIPVAAMIERCTIQEWFHGTFWCGFCKKIVPLKKKRNEGWDERFNHIGEHFENGLIIGGWLSLEWNVPEEETPVLVNDSG